MPGRRFQGKGERMPHKVEVAFDEFGFAALSREAELQGITVEELVYHAAIYYLAGDPDKISHRVPRDRPPEEPDDPSA